MQKAVSLLDTAQYSVTEVGYRLVLLTALLMSYRNKIYHSATFPAIPKSIVAVTTPNALNTLLIVGIVML